MKKKNFLISTEMKVGISAYILGIAAAVLCTCWLVAECKKGVNISVVLIYLMAAITSVAIILAGDVLCGRPLCNAINRIMPKPVKDIRQRVSKHSGEIMTAFFMLFLFVSGIGLIVMGVSDISQGNVYNVGDAGRGGFLVSVGAVFVCIIGAFAVGILFGSEREFAQKLTDGLFGLCFVAWGIGIPIFSKDISMLPLLILGAGGVYMLVRLAVEIFSPDAKDSVNEVDDFVEKRIVDNVENVIYKFVSIKSYIVMVIIGGSFLMCGVLPLLFEEYIAATPFLMLLLINGSLGLAGLVLVGYGVIKLIKCLKR